ncbi:hypothetical protein ScalyP_jg6352 [Parmales sp. scaly parma]|nr:hypothetical protein ScalyP_jg6352 [Parmales sp. scaly parma]
MIVLLLLTSFLGALAFTPTTRGRVVTFSALNGSIAPKDFKTGLTVNLDGVPTKIVDFSHSKTARASASTKTKFKNLLTGTTLERTVKASETFDPAIIERKKAQYTFTENGLWNFMDSESYEEQSVSDEVVKDDGLWLEEGMEVTLICYEEKAIGFDFPSKYVYEVIRTDPNVKGNSAQGVTKPATVANGAILTVPGFVEQGEMIEVDLDSKLYMKKFADGGTKKY